MVAHVRVPMCIRFVAVFFCFLFIIIIIVIIVIIIIKFISGSSAHITVYTHKTYIKLYKTRERKNNNKIIIKQEFVRPRWPYDMRPLHVCHCNSLGGATWRSVTIDNGTDGLTDRQTDRQTDGQSATQYAAPPREEGRIKSPAAIVYLAQILSLVMLLYLFVHLQFMYDPYCRVQ